MDGASSFWRVTGKLTTIHSIGIPLTHVPLINMDNASALLLTFDPDPKQPPMLLCFNWISSALWLAAGKAELISAFCAYSDNEGAP